MISSWAGLGILTLAATQWKKLTLCGFQAFNAGTLMPQPESRIGAVCLPCVKSEKLWSTLRILLRAVPHKKITAGDSGKARHR